MNDLQALFKRAERVARALIDQGREREARRLIDACADLYLTGCTPGLLAFLPPGRRHKGPWPRAARRVERLLRRYGARAGVDARADT